MSSIPGCGRCWKKILAVPSVGERRKKRNVWEHKNTKKQLHIRPLVNFHSNLGRWYELSLSCIKYDEKDAKDRYFMNQF